MSADTFYLNSCICARHFKYTMYVCMHYIHINFIIIERNHPQTQNIDLPMVHEMSLI